jgi:NADH-quinone oxidoreductase subunit N
MFSQPGQIGLLQSQLTASLLYFMPETILCATVVLLLVVRLFPRFDRRHLGLAALLLTLTALAWAVGDWLSNPTSTPLFTGMLVFDQFTASLRVFLLAFAALIIWLTLLTGIPDREDSADFYCLLLGATIGMMIMAQANHLLMVYLGIEMASLPSYALAGFLKGKRQSSEAALKYVVYGGGASGIMVYGISLLAGKFGTAYLPDLATGYVAALQAGGDAVVPFDLVLALGTLFVLMGFGFKLAAVPFHFWCPDVFEGACAEVAAFLSVASKGAALALAGRFVLVLAGPGRQLPPNAAMLHYLIPALAVFAALTATFGNLAAYLQTNLKRLLAYSTIAHAGYMMMGLATLTTEGVAAVLFYLVAYLFMNLGAFAVVAFLRNQTGSEDLESFRGLVRRSPWMVITLSIFLLSLLGIPPLAGFAAKFQIFAALYHAGESYRAAATPEVFLSNTMYALLVIGGINTVISAVYYIKVMKVMILDTTIEDLEKREPTPLREPAPSVLYATLLAAVLFIVGILWNPVALASEKGVKQFQPPSVSAPGGRGGARGGGEGDGGGRGGGARGGRGGRGARGDAEP